MKARNIALTSLKYTTAVVTRTILRITFVVVVNESKEEYNFGNVAQLRTSSRHRQITIFAILMIAILRFHPPQVKKGEISAHVIGVVVSCHHVSLLGTLFQ